MCKCIGHPFDCPTLVRLPTHPTFSKSMSFKVWVFDTSSSEGRSRVVFTVKPTDNHLTLPDGDN